MGNSDLLGSLMSQLGGGGVDQIARTVGVSGGDVTNVLAGALPAMMAGLTRNAASSGGASALLGALDRCLQVRPCGNRHTITGPRGRCERRLHEERRRSFRRTRGYADEPEHAPARTAGSVQPAADACGASDQLGSTKR